MTYALQILGEYHPNVWNRLVIGRELGLRLKELGLAHIKRPWRDDTPHSLLTANLDELEWAFEITVREPEFYIGNHKDVREWHRDGHMNGAPMSIVLWNSETPTEFLMPNGSIFQPKPFEVVLADNDKVKHRMPEVTGANRWFFRQAVQTPLEAI